MALYKKQPTKHSIKQLSELTTMPTPLLIGVGKMERRRSEQRGGNGDGEVQLPELPTEPLEFLARSWSASALQVSKALAPPTPKLPTTTTATTTATNGGCSSNSDSSFSSVVEDVTGGGDVETEDSAAAAIPGNGNPLLSFSFASSATSQLVLERIMSQSEISPLTSGRLSHSSGPLNSSHAEETDSAPVSPSDDFDDVVKYLRSNNSLQPLFTGKNNVGGGGGGGVSTPSGKTVGRWLKERREKKKEEARTHNAQLHAVVSVAGVAAAVAAIAAATAAASASEKDDQMAKTDMAVASAATLVAAQCVEAAEAMGAERDHLVSAISSAVNVRSHGDITTLTAAAATALRGAATLKARALKEVWNIAAVIPVEKGVGMRMSGSVSSSDQTSHTNGSNHNEGLALEENFLGAFNQELLARGTELLKRTSKGDLHWKIVSVYIHRTGQVMLKMKSRHVAGTITKKKKSVVLEVCRDVASWPGRHLFEDGEQRRYFGLKTATRGVVEFECKNQKEYDVWTQGVSRLLSITAERKNKCHNK
ncbi:VAN3-binding protein-like isoform X1 [Camellia sinensis]|uniref:VAN3-binding protein-like isoform X1 n=1 Tax=Camellia sinensis TaxID=4442 RepID=UPI001036C79C|nr:VAN3-binding protein-like isoform X1 [Camellia sinensis]